MIWHTLIRCNLICRKRMSDVILYGTTQYTIIETAYIDMMHSRKCREERLFMRCHLLEVILETSTVPELSQKLLHTTPSGWWWWWCIASVFRNAPWRFIRRSTFSTGLGNLVWACRTDPWHGASAVAHHRPPERLKVDTDAGACETEAGLRGATSTRKLRLLEQSGIIIRDRKMACRDN